MREAVLPRGATSALLGCLSAAGASGPPSAADRDARPVPAGGRRAVTVYVCVACDVRQLGVQRCVECGLFGTAAGIGGACPSCQEPVTVAELIEG